MGSTDPRHITLLLNPAAGRGRVHRLLPRIVRRLEQELPDSQLRVVQSANPDDLVRQALLAVSCATGPEPGIRPDALCMLGGDGTASIGLNACAGSGVSLGVIPAGTGNDFVRGIGAPRSARDAVTAIVAGVARRIDLTAVHLVRHADPTTHHTQNGDAQPMLQARSGDSQPFCHVGSVVCTGYDAAVNMHVNNSPIDLGKLSYVWALLAERRSFRPERYRMSIDGGPDRNLDALLVAVGNAGVIGGGIRICPEADPSDGRLDVTVVHPVRMTKLARSLPALYSGGIAAIDEVETFRCRRIVLDGDWQEATGDGEPIGPGPLDMRCDPGCLDVLVAP
ncbi:diacylglycerol/lipid kinase family protein [Propionibacterium sp.]|uniref:diacylglycerol/lipid kinase family protein n=1 Tax=Propionibacterium sp. TaxID=1977903 RepID=UPI0039E9C5C8